MRTTNGYAAMNSVKNNLLIFTLIVSSILFSQSEIDEMIEEVYAGKTSSAFEQMPRMKREFSDIPSLLFLDALIDQDIDRSIEKFKKFFKYYESSEYADDAITVSYTHLTLPTILRV